MCWASVNFGDVVELQQGLAFNKKNNYLMVDEGIPLLRIKDLINNTETKFVDRERVSPKFISKPNDLIYTRTGQVGLVFRGRVGVVHNNCFRILPGDDIDRDYLYWYLRQPSVIAYARSIATGAAQPDLSHPAFKSITFRYPDKNLQQKIASILSAYDDLIENDLRRIKILEEMAQNLYREWFINFRFPGHEKVRMVDSEIGKVPVGWDIKKFKDVSLNYDRLRKPLSKMQRSERSGPYPYYGAAKIFDYIDDFIFDGVYLLIAEDGSVITPERRPVLQYASGKFWANNHTHIVQGREPFSTEFLYLMLANLDIGGYITGAAQPKITQTNLNRIPLVTGPMQIQRQFDDLVLPMFRQMVTLRAANGVLRSSRDLLLPKLISGELDVSELDVEVPEEAA
jgi:type I restriction enzyme S subunit